MIPCVGYGADNRYMCSMLYGMKAAKKYKRIIAGKII